MDGREASHSNNAQITANVCMLSAVIIATKLSSLSPLHAGKKKRLQGQKFDTAFK